MKKILFISHDAQRAGAPILLLRFLKLLALNKDFHFDVLVKNDGPLISEFESIASTIHWNTEFKPFNSDSMQSYYHKLGVLAGFSKRKQKKHQSEIIAKIKKSNYDLIVANTIASGELLMAIGKIDCPIVSYLHELEIGFKMFSEPKYIKYQLEHTANYWVPSMAVKQNLINNHNIPEAKIEVLRTIIDIKPDKFSNTNIRKSLGISENSIVVGTVATVDLRKGYDLFLQVVNQCKNKKNLYFVWLGANFKSEEYLIMQADVKKLQIGHLISICANTTEPASYYEMFDILLLPSREDPYPLVTLEAAQYGIPTVCFNEQAGGACDFVANDAGLVVDFLNVTDMAKAVLSLAENPSLRKENGDNALKKVNDWHSLENGYKQFINLLNQNIAK